MTTKKSAAILLFTWTKIYLNLRFCNEINELGVISMPRTVKKSKDLAPGL